MGKSDYEYVTTVPKLEKLYPLIKLEKGDKRGLFDATAGKFNTNSCYSDFYKFLDQSKIDYGGYSWH